MIKYYSQDGQDKYLVEELFKNKNSGFFVEVGANDGITFSNTKALEDLGWNGVCIEPIPEIFKFLEMNRNCIVHNVAIGIDTTEVEFLNIKGYSEMLSGIISNYDTRHLERINNEIMMHGGSKEVIKIKSFKFSDLITEKYIDYLSIDTEGSELDVLKSIDFNTNNIYCISIEKNYEDNSAFDFLIKQNYKFVRKIGADMFFILNNIQ